MILRLVARHITRQRRRVAAALLSVAAASAAVTAAATFAIGSEEKIVERLRALGPNIRVTPKPATAELPGVGAVPAVAAPLREEDASTILEIGWRNNLLGVAPVLRVGVQVHPWAEGARLLGSWFGGGASGPDRARRSVSLLQAYPRWSLAEGRWPRTSDEVVVAWEAKGRWRASLGSVLGLHGTSVWVFGPEVVGVLSPGIGAEAGADLLGTLDLAQSLSGGTWGLDAILVNALTCPEELAPRDPRALKGAERERWECTPYPSSIAWQIGQALPHARAETIREMAAAEGATVRRISGALALAAALAALLGTAGVALALAGAVLQRREEIALLRALGASAGVLVGLLAGEGVALGLSGGALGWAAGVGLAQAAALGALGGTIPAVPALAPLVLALAVLVALAGVAAPARRVLAARPAEVLRGV
ncbi:MAG: hypothetical protein L0216_20570 [Planctomycetales bacterium]|nr:hypothetical protein [Planctomycetales bacterium]